MMAAHVTKSLVMIPPERIEGIILLIRGEKVILDTNLAELYGVETRALIQAVIAESRAFSDGFYVTIDASGVRLFEITICDLKR